MCSLLIRMLFAAQQIRNAVCCQVHKRSQTNRYKRHFRTCWQMALGNVKEFSFLFGLPRLPLDSVVFILLLLDEWWNFCTLRHFTHFYLIYFVVVLEQPDPFVFLWLYSGFFRCHFIYFWNVCCLIHFDKFVLLNIFDEKWFCAEEAMWYVLIYWLKFIKHHVALALVSTPMWCDVSRTSIWPFAQPF